MRYLIPASVDLTDFLLKAESIYTEIDMISNPRKRVINSCAELRIIIPDVEKSIRA